MAYKIPSDCMACDSCRPQCPTGAIEVDNGQLWIDSALCNNCEGYHDKPICVESCPIDLPVISQPKKGRAKIIDDRPFTNPDLFANGKNNPFASAIIIWEACNLLSQRQSLTWQQSEGREVVYQRSINQGKGEISLKILDCSAAASLAKQQDSCLVESLDIRAACVHLIYAAYATTLEKPWEQDFLISDRQIEEYLGLDKRKDLSKPVKLNLIKKLAQQPCAIEATIYSPRQGRIDEFSIEKENLWHLLEVKHHFYEDELGCKHLAGLTFRIKAGMWAKHFLNKHACRDRKAFYQYSSLPQSLLEMVMSNWQQHEGAVRMMLWLLFKTRMGREQRLTVPTLMRIAYGEKRLHKANCDREERKRLLRTFENDLLVLNDYKLKPVFDTVTYPPEIQPLWVKLSAIPDDSDEAIDFWINDGSSNNRLTDASPRGKWNSLMNARIVQFELPDDWEQTFAQLEKKRQKLGISKLKNIASRKKLAIESAISGEHVASARKDKGWSQRELAKITGKSQSWIRDIENGRFHIKPEDQSLLQQVLALD
ncbi:MAG: helix-turn-helix domain-containing protein [Hydrococcus sp. Prado102]|jgi:DNA-binding transcriptional regulator YiaG|nr:helix-turn-helix domain-containing protein [Hydrococcus sp. Prado102]